MVSTLKTSEFFLIFRKNILCRVDKYCRICLMCRGTVKIELSRISCIITCKLNLLSTHSYVHTVFVLKLIILAVNSNCTVTADIDNTHLTSLKEICSSEFCTCLKCKCLCCRCSSTYNNSVNLAVYSLNLVSNKKILNEEIMSQSVSIVILYVCRISSWSYFHCNSPFYKFLHCLIS